MIGRKKLPELRGFERAEKALRLRTDSEFAGLVVPNGNDATAGHRWFKYKEAFSSALLGKVVADLLSDRNPSGAIRLLDPYCGIGTSLLSAQLMDRAIESIGIECNPFSAFVARTKLAWPAMDQTKIRNLASDILENNLDGDVDLPPLSSISKGRCITRYMARQVVQIRLILESLPPSYERDALLLGLASAIEPVSRIRRDGRALRIVNKKRKVLRNVLADRWNSIANDIEYLKSNHPLPRPASVSIGDGRQPSSVGIEDESIDLILTSPPYPNNIDYNEVYKLELWLLDFARDADEFLALRRSTFRSHPTCKPLDDEANDADGEFQEMVSRGPFEDLMGMVLRRVERLERDGRRGRSKVLLGYVFDTWKSLQAHYQALCAGGCAVYVVGNSLHGGADRPYLIPTDLLVANLARHVGFKVEQIIVARGLQRRLVGNHYLRDSVVVLRKN